MSDLKYQILISARENLSNAASRAGEAMAKLEGKFDRLRKASDKLTAAGRGLFTTGGGLLAGIGLGMKAFSELEQSEVSLKNVLGTVDGLDKHFDSLNKKAVQLGNTLPGSTKDFYDLIVGLRRGGQEAGTIDDGLLEATAKLKVVQRLTSDIAGEGMATTANAFRLTGSEITRFADILNRTANASRISVPGLFEAMKYAGASARSLGWQGLDSATQMSTLMGALSGTGIDPSQVGTAISQGVAHIAGIKTRIIAARGALWGNVGRILDKNGIRLDFFDERGEMSIPRMVSQMEKLKGLTREQRLMVGETLFGAEGSRLALIGSSDFNTQARRQLSMEHLNRQIDRETRTISGRLENLFGTISNVSGKFFTPVANRIKGILDRTNSLLGRFDAWQDANPRFAASFAYVATAIGLLLTSLGGMTWLIGKVMSAWALLKTVVMAAGVFLNGALVPALAGAAKAVWAFGAAFMSTPVGWITAAVAALVAVGIILWKNWDRIAAWSRRTFPELSAVFGKAWDQMRAAFSRLWSSIKPLLADLVGAFGKAWSSLKAALAPLMPVLLRLWEAIKPLVGPLLKAWAVSVLLPVAVALGTIAAAAYGLIKALTWLVRWWTFLIDVGRKVLGFLTGFYGTAFKAGAGLLEAFTKGISSAAMKPVEAIKSVVGKIRRFLPFSPAKEGPLSDIHKIRLMETIAESMTPMPLLDRMRRIAADARSLAPRMAAGAALLVGPAAMAGGASRPVVHLTINNIDARGAAPGVGLDIRRAVLSVVPELERELERRSTFNARRRF